MCLCTSLGYHLAVRQTACLHGRHQALCSANVILVFARSIPNSIKTFTRTQRSGSSRFYKLTPDMQAPAKQVVLTNTKNKIQLNAMITDGTGGLRIDRHGLYSTHEAADILIAQHAISYLLLGKYVRVVCDDRDVFVLLVHYYNSRYRDSISAPMIMPSPVKELAVIDIRATVL